MNRILLGVIAATFLAAGATLYGEAPARTDKQIAALLDLVAKAGYESVTEVSYDDGMWEVEAMKGQAAVELHLDRRSGKVLSERSDGPHRQLAADGKPLAEIVSALEKAGYGPISKIEFESTGWQVEAKRGVQWRELAVDLNGKVVADHPED